MLVACDKFKGTLSSVAVGSGIAGGLTATDVACRVLEVADGGEGTARTLLRHLGGEVRLALVHDAFGAEVAAEFILLGDGKTAAVDAAQAVGLGGLEKANLDPWSASTAGAGELIAAAASAGATEVILAPGGTATLDGGFGAIELLRDFNRVPKLKIVCDVRTTWEFAARTFGPQKGADTDLIAALEQRLNSLARSLPRDPRGVSYSGCGGGLSGGLWASFDAELVEGANFVLQRTDFFCLLPSASLVITGEGCLDAQTLDGKLVMAIAKGCKAAEVPCLAVVGRNALGREAADQLGLIDVLEAGTPEKLHRVGVWIGCQMGSGHQHPEIASGAANACI